MKLIKELKNGAYTLKHHTYIDYFGFKRDSFEVTKLEPNGMIVNKPFIGDIKVNLHTRTDSISDLTTKYTEKEYKDMLTKNSDF